MFGNLWQLLATFSILSECVKEVSVYLNFICPTILPFVNLYIFLCPFKSFLVIQSDIKSGAVLNLHVGWYHFTWYILPVIQGFGGSCIYWLHNLVGEDSL